MKFSHISPPLHPFSFSPPLAPSSFKFSSVPSAQNNTTVQPVSHPCPGTLGVGVPVQCCLGVCAAPILITLGEHTCENRCPPGLACCSSLGWSVCVWLSASPPPPPPPFLSSAQSSSGPQQAVLAPAPRQEGLTAASGGGAGSSGPQA